MTTFAAGSPSPPVLEDIPIVPGNAAAIVRDKVHAAGLSKPIPDAGAKADRGAAPTSETPALVYGLCAPEHAPNHQGAWRRTFEGSWFNDVSQQKCEIGDQLGPPPPKGPHTYRATFDDGTDGWDSLTTATSRNVQWSQTGGRSGGYIFSDGPWWLDTNHGPPGGPADLNIVAWTWSWRLIPNAHDHLIDFRNSRVSMWIRGEDVDLKGSHLVFWIQSRLRNSAKSANYAYTSKPLDAALNGGEWTQLSFDLPNNESDWTCLGTTAAKEDTYTCTGLNEALGDVTTDFGLILYPLNFRPSLAPEDAAFPDRWQGSPRGRISLDDFELQYRLR
jgi:hypothetical protein